ncbi:hypothetical protein [Desulfosarcina sp.]|uniref:hypothetical protein n=1 Tax=Desulfosarcina sp. TaxID=2027861 RepID=UPI003566410B
MLSNSRTDRQWLIPFMWMGMGLVSGYLSNYLFSYILSPLLIETVRATNANTQFVILNNIVNMIFANMADFMLCFLFAMVLGYFSKITVLRGLLYVFGAIVVSLYTQMVGLIGYMGTYSELPAWAVASEMQGLISLLLIMPLCSIAGSKVGAWIKMKRNPD